MKEKKQKDIQETRRLANPFWGLILAIVFGIFSGITGDIIFRYYFESDWQSSWVNQEWDLLNNDFDASKIIIQDAKKVVVSQDDKMGELADGLKPSMFSVFDRIEGLAASSTPYDLSSPILRAFVVSSDGWLLAIWPEELSSATSSLPGLVALDSQRKQYPIDRVISGAARYPQIAFIHITGASNLEVKRFASVDDFYAAQTVLASDGNRSVLPGYIYSTAIGSGQLSSDEQAKSSSFSNGLAEGGQLVLSPNGDFLGLLRDDSSIFPAFIIKSYWESGIASGELSLAKLGLAYYDLSYQYLPSVGRDKGALVTDVTVNSAAEISGLRAGDIITHLGNYELTASRNLSDLVATYKPGDVINAIYLRGGVETQAKITLK